MHECRDFVTRYVPYAKGAILKGYDPLSFSSPLQRIRARIQYTIEDDAPDRAEDDRFATSAQPTFEHASFEDRSQLSYVDMSFDLTEQIAQERGAAPSPSNHVVDAHLLLIFPSCGPTDRQMRIFGALQRT